VPRSGSDARVHRICAVGGDAMTLRLQLLDAIRSAIPFDFHVWLLTDPETSVGAAPLADVPAPLLPRLPELIRLKYLTTVNRWTSLTGAALLSSGDRSHSRVWRELLADQGVADVASVVFRDRYGCWGFLDLWRSTPFAVADAAFLAGIAEPVTAALRRSQADTFAAVPVRDPGHDGPAVLLLSPTLEVVGTTPETHDYLRVLVPPAEGHSPVPAGAYNVAAQLLANEEGIDLSPPRARIHLADGSWLSMRAARIGADGIAVTIEKATPAERLALFARAAGLSAREAEVLDHLAAGPGTRELAHRLHLSEHTVQDHLKAIFAKTGTRSRQSLVSRALGG
jgi:DNA-binding CsgD family transcriptional regulator